MYEEVDGRSRKVNGISGNVDEKQMFKDMDEAEVYERGGWNRWKM